MGSMDECFYAFMELQRVALPGKYAIILVEGRVSSLTVVDGWFGSERNIYSADNGALNDRILTPHSVMQLV